MIPNNRFRCSQGFVLAELVVVVLVLGLAMIPIIRGMLMLPQVAAAVSAQNRSESWRSLCDQAVSVGIDPTATSVLSSVSAEPVTGLQGTLARTNLGARTGAPQIVFLTETFSGVAESRSTGGGFEVGQGTAIPPRVDPVPPLAPIKLETPSLNPPDRSFFALFSLAPPAVAGDPYLGNIRASGGAGDFIRLGITAPSGRTSDAIGLSDISVTAFELAQGVKGETWAEYNGNPSTDIALRLRDGRMLWLLTDKDTGRVQPIEPSDKIIFKFGVSIGAPVYSVAGKDYISVDPIGVDFATAYNIASGTASAVFTYPQAVKDRFGSTWDKIELSYDWSWENDRFYPGDSSAGDTVAFYAAEARQHWQEQQSVTVTPTSPLAGLNSGPATWRVQQRVTTLSAPDRTTALYDQNSLSDLGGNFDYRVPVLHGTNPQIRKGRPRVGGVESAGDAVTIPVYP